MSAFTAFIESMDKVLRVMLAVMMALLVIDVTWQVLTRFILPQPSSFTEEVARFLLIWVSLIGGAYAYRLHSHLGFDWFVRNMAIGKAVLVYRFCCILVAIFAVWVLIIGGGNLVSLTWLLGQYSPVLDVPMAFIYFAIPFSGFLFLIYSLYFFIAAASITQQARVPLDEQENAND